MSASFASHAVPRSHVYVYRGEGAGWRSVRSTYDSLKRLLPSQYEVHTLTAQQLLDGGWAADAALLVMPGGADLPYCKHLNGRGNALIKGFVSSGGAYLGLCAGAYYACSRVEFEPGSPLQVVGERELCFFSGIAKGAAFPGFDYQTEAGSVAAELHFQVPTALSAATQQQTPCEQQQPLVLQQLLDEQLRACHAQQCTSSISSSCQVTGVAKDACGQGSWCFTRDYCNGGPFFVTREGHLDLNELPGVQVLAQYCQLPLRTPPQQQQQQGMQQQVRSAGPNHLGSSMSGMEPLLQPVAAVRCQVGSGVAVLCGTHPELEPHWLDTCGQAQEGPRSADGEQQQAEVLAGTMVLAANGVLAAAAEHRESAKLLQVAAASSGSTVGSSSSSDAGVGGRIAECADTRLAVHTEALRRTLAACQGQRDLFLLCLLYEVLRHLKA